MITGGHVEVGARGRTHYADCRKVWRCRLAHLRVYMAVCGCVSANDRLVCSQMLYLARDKDCAAKPVRLSCVLVACL